MNKKIISTVLVVLALGIIGYTYMQSRGGMSFMGGDDTLLQATSTDSNGTSTKKPTSGTATNENLKKDSTTYLARDGVYVVQYTDNGFVPKSLQIPRGKSVRFINMSQRGLRVFSDVSSDPKFSELNQSKTIGKGGTYTFSFVNEGLWTYHNEVQSSDKANIIVY